MTASTLLLLTALLGLLLAIVLGTGRALKGPTLSDRLLALQLMGSGGVAWLLLLSPLLGLPALLDVALLLALLAIVATAALTQREAS